MEELTTTSSPISVVVIVWSDALVVGRAIHQVQIIALTKAIQQGSISWNDDS